MNPKHILNESDQKALLSLARETVREGARAGRMPQGPDVATPLLKSKRGVFVTLHQEGALRGCIGFPYPVKPLVEACREAAFAAAFEDPRFPRVVEEEVDGLEFEISVLSPPEPIRPEDVRVGVHGLYFRQGSRSGLLLPQVATEYGWTAGEFLSQTCRKAGLPPDAWKAGGDLFGFEAQIFNETDMKKRG